MHVELGDLRPTTELLWRIHKTGGGYPSAWNDFRATGPLPQMRWDPHPPPVGADPFYGVLYASTDFRTAVAEVFQSTKRIDAYTGEPKVSTFVPDRPLQLLELFCDGAPWLIRHDASHSLMHGRKSTCRNWAHAIREDAPHVDGLWVESTMTGEATTVLFSPAAAALPTAARDGALLTSPLILKALEDVAASLGPSWRFVRAGYLRP